MVNHFDPRFRFPWLFSPVPSCPRASVPLYQALVECLLQMRVDAYKLLRLHRRPEACPAQDIGLWSSVVESMGYLAVLTNVAILCFTTPTLHGLDELHKWLIFLVRATLCTQSFSSHLAQF